MNQDELLRRMARMAEDTDRLCIRESERWLWALGCCAAFAAGVLLVRWFA